MLGACGTGEVGMRNCSFTTGGVTCNPVGSRSTVSLGEGTRGRENTGAGIIVAATVFVEIDMFSVAIGVGGGAAVGLPRSAYNTARGLIFDGARTGAGASTGC